MQRSGSLVSQGSWCKGRGGRWSSGSVELVVSIKKATGGGLQGQVCWWMSLVNPSAAPQYLYVKDAEKCRGTCPVLSVPRDLQALVCEQRVPFYSRTFSKYNHQILLLSNGTLCARGEGSALCVLRVLMEAAIQEEQSSLMPAGRSAHLQWDRAMFHSVSPVWQPSQALPTPPSVHCQHTGHLKHHSH